MDNSLPPTHPHHTKLYIAVAVLVVFAAAFFLLKREVVAPIESNPGMSAEELLRIKAAQVNETSEPIMLSPQELKLKQTQLTEKSPPVKLTEEELQAKKLQIQN